LHKPVRFEARVTPLLPSKKALTVELILKAGNGPERTVRMEADGDRYRLTTVPIPGQAEPRSLRLVARFENATLEATTTDRSFKVGRRELALGEVRTIRPGSPSRVVLQGGDSTTGALVGLETVPVLLSGQIMAVDLASAKEVTITPAGESDQVGYTLIVRQGAKEFYRQSQSSVSRDLVKIVEAARFAGHQGHVENVVVSPDGRHVLSGADDRNMILWDRATRGELRRFGPHGGQVMSAAFAPESRHALSGGEDQIIRLWDLDSGAVIREFRGHTEWVMSVALSPDGHLAYSVAGAEPVARDFAVRVWDVETGRQVSTMNGHSGKVRCLAVSVDGRRILSGGDTIILWDAETRTEIRRLQGHTDKVDSVAFLPDGRRAASSGWDGTIRLWDSETGDELHCFRGLARNTQTG
jgi:WD40 repeat protein